MTATILQFRHKPPDLKRMYDSLIDEATALHLASIELVKEAYRVQYAVLSLLFDPPEKP